jgi:outer membrane autotransporter protein
MNKIFRREKVYFVVGGMIAAACLPGRVPAQSLDAAVIEQLRTVNGVPCAVLRGADPITVFEGGLLEICTRGTAAGSSPGAGSSGGGAGTPTALPSVVKGRLEGAPEEKDTSESGTTETTLQLGRWSAFISGEYEALDRDVTNLEDGYDSDIWRLTVGADVQPTDRTVVGAAFVGYRQDGDFKSGGDFDVDSLGALVYGSYLPTGATFVQVSAGYFGKSNERQRVATFTSDDAPVFTRTGRPDADYDTDEWGAGLLAGYDHAIGSLTVGPRLGLDWIYANHDSYREKGGSGLELAFDEDDVKSLQSTLGVQGTAAISTGGGVLSPQVTLAWKHEFENDQRDIDVSFVGDTRSKQFSYETDKPDRDYFEANAGVVFVLPNGVQAFANYGMIFGHRFLDSAVGSIGARMEF